MDAYLKESLKIDGVQIGDVLILPVNQVQKLINTSEKIGKEKEILRQKEIQDALNKKYYLGSKEACKQLGVKSYRTIANRIRAGKIGGKLIGGNWMVSQYDVDQYINKSANKKTL